MPFADYKDFADCVKKNSDKKDPQAYCATIERAVHGKESLVSEVIDAKEAQFSTDETTGRMTGRVKIIQAGRAKNPRNYRSSALRKAAKEGIYNGLRMFVNHSDKPPLKRSLSELVSAVESTEYDPKTDSIYGNIEYFNKEFFDYAQRAKNYMGVSASHRIRVNYVQEGSRMIEDVQEIVGAHSVDWVVFPSAGGEVISFARESEGADDVEWSEVTLDQLKQNAPQILEEYKTSLARESADPDPPDDGEKITKAEVGRIVAEQVASIQSKMIEDATKKEVTVKKIRDFVSKSGLPSRTQNRLISQFLGTTSFVEEDVKEAVEEAKAELKEAGAGPRIVGMGPSGSTGDESPRKIISAKESVETYFGFNKKKEQATTTTATPKES